MRGRRKKVKGKVRRREGGTNGSRKMEGSERKEDERRRRGREKKREDERRKKKKEKYTDEKKRKRGRKMGEETREDNNWEKRKVGTRKEWGGRGGGPGNQRKCLYTVRDLMWYNRSGF